MKKPIAVRGVVEIGRLIMLTAGILLAGCSIKSPQAPSWDTTLSIPLLNRTFSSGELFDKLAAGDIQTDSAGNSSFSVERHLDSVSVRNVLSLDSSASEFSKQVGLIAVATPQIMSQQIAFADYLPLVAGVVPETGLWVNKTIGPTSTFSEANLAQGGLIVTATNNTGFALDSLVGQVREPDNGALIATFVAPHGLAAGASFCDTLPLAGKTVRGLSDFDVYFHTPGGLALSLADYTIEFEVSFIGLYANSVTGKVAAFSHEYDSRSALGDDMHIQTASFASGVLDFTVENHLPVDAQLVVSFPEITFDGTPLTMEIPVSGYGSERQIQNLAAWTIQPHLDSLQAHLVANVLSSGDNYVTVNSTDGFGFQFALSGLEFESATGIIEPTDINWDDQNINIEIPRGFDNISLASVELEITVLNHSELTGDVEINLIASNGKHLTVSGNVASGSAGAPSTNIIYSNQLADLLSPLPDTITFSGIATVGDGVTAVQITNQDYLSGKAVISAPMAFMLTETTVESDKNHLEVDADVVDRVDRLQQGVFRSTITNHLPIGAQLTIYIGADSATVFSNPLTTIGPVGFTAATVNSDGIVTAQSVSDNTIELTKDDLQVFRNRSLYIASRVSLPGTNNQIVHIRASDYFVINGIVEISARVGGEEF